MIRTGIFGGSFNPIHNGHISLARQLKQREGLDEVWLMVSPQNPLKASSTDLLSDEARMEMARKALEGVEGIIACDYEMHLPKPSYTWNTLQALSRDYPEREFVLMIGGDNWQGFHRWYRAEDILREYQVVVYPRSEADIQAVSADDSGRVTIVKAELLDVSSTMIRQYVHQGRDIGRLVPAVIAPLVRRLYQLQQ